MTWQLDLMMSYPHLFARADDPKLSQGYPCVGDGWRPIVERAIERIDTVLAGGRVEIVQIKEKLGGLRIYFYSKGLPAGVLATVREAIDLAEARADCTCETCGAVGRLHDKGGWLATRCELHADGQPVEPQHGDANLHVKWTIQDGKMRVISCRQYDRERDAFFDAPLPKSLKDMKDK
jgi:hypothetical protein